jgi:hypothetical protein
VFALAVAWCPEPSLDEALNFLSGESWKVGRRAGGRAGGWVDEGVGVGWVGVGAVGWGGGVGG